MGELNDYTVQRVDHSLEEVTGFHVELNWDIAEFKEDSKRLTEQLKVKLPE